MPDIIFSSFLSGGIGVAAGSVATAIIQTFARKGEARAEAANIIADAAGGLADRLDKMNTVLTNENRKLRKAVIMLTDVLDEIIPEVHMGSEQAERLREAINTAKLVL